QTAMTQQPPLARELFAQLQGAPMQQIARQLGTDQDQAGNAVATALPLLLGALGRNSAQPQGAEALFGALQRDHAAGPDLGGLLGAVLGGAAAAARPMARRSSATSSAAPSRARHRAWARPPALAAARRCSC